jgi:hypothetical protein
LRIANFLSPWDRENIVWTRIWNAIGIGSSEDERTGMLDSDSESGNEGERTGMLDSDSESGGEGAYMLDSNSYTDSGDEGGCMLDSNSYTSDPESGAKSDLLKSP